MKAVICTQYGAPEVLQIREVAMPTPNDNEILVEIHYTTVHIGDTKIRRLEPGMGAMKDLFIKPMMRFMIGFRRPRRSILGMEFSGIVNDIGKDVTRFKKGDYVFGSTQLKFGTYAEFCCVSENSIVTTSANNMQLEAAAPLSNASVTALHYLRKGKITKGQNVLIYGASGSVGSYAVQIAKHFGATVTGVCSTANTGMVKSLNADFVIDYKTEDFTQNGKYYDLIFDAVGKIPTEKRKISLSNIGVYVNVLSDNFKMKIEDLELIKDMYKQGSLITCIDRTYSIDQIVEAHRYVDKGHKKGNVLIKVIE